ncbi:MAG: DUF1385 domain-containing protein [Armatimonadota bacterium]
MENETGINELIKGAPVISPQDTIKRAAGLMRGFQSESILVFGLGEDKGILTEKAITEYLSKQDDPKSALNDPVAPLIDRNLTYININFTMKMAAETFSEKNVDILPVVNENGVYQGVITRSDLVAKMTSNLRPPNVAGMATPLGVYLTTGSHKAGAPNIGLFLTGVFQMMLIIIAGAVVFGLRKLFAYITGIPVDIMAASTPLTVAPHIYDFATYISVILVIGIMLLLLRMSPLSGYHAAEHMTVHAIEAGEELTTEIVGRMPRVHARCGTNLIAAAGIFIIITTMIGSAFAVMVALVAVVLGWRQIGGWLQYIVTTKNPTQKQLESGVKAGLEIIEEYHKRPNYVVTGFERIWNIGLIQVAGGLLTVMLLLWLIEIVFNITLI